jgi:hypothetical protein
MAESLLEIGGVPNGTPPETRTDAKNQAESKLAKLLFFNIHEEALVKSIAGRIRDLHTSIRHLRSSRTATNFISAAPLQAHGVAGRQLKNRDAVLDPAISFFELVMVWWKRFRNYVSFSGHPLRFLPGLSLS